MAETMATELASAVQSIPAAVLDRAWPNSSFRLWLLDAFADTHRSATQVQMDH